MRRRVNAELEAIRDFSADAVVIGSNLTMLLSARIAGCPYFLCAPVRLLVDVFFEEACRWRACGTGVVACGGAGVVV